MTVYSLDVKKTLNKIPRDGVIDIVVVALMEDNNVKAYSTCETDDLAADLLYDALAVYEGTQVAVELEG